MQDTQVLTHQFWQTMSSWILLYALGLCHAETGLGKCVVGCTHEVAQIIAVSTLQGNEKYKNSTRSKGNHPGSPVLCHRTTVTKASFCFCYKMPSFIMRTSQTNSNLCILIIAGTFGPHKNIPTHRV